MCLLDRVRLAFVVVAFPFTSRLGLLGVLLFCVRGGVSECRGDASSLTGDEVIRHSSHAQ